MLKLRTKFRCVIAAYMVIPIAGMIFLSHNSPIFQTPEFQQILGVNVAVVILLAFCSPVLLGLKWIFLTQVGEISFAISRIKTGNYTYFTLPNEPSETGDENELVALMRDMNWMIRQIEYRETELEERVAQRTRELEEINAQLVKARDDARASARAKSEFLSTMSHEIRTPMNAVIGMSDLALKSSRDSRQQEVLTVINTASKSLLKIINDILDFSKMDAGKLVLESIPVRLREVMDEAADLFRTDVREAPVEFILDIDPEVPQAVAGDPLRLRQVMVNLISNAFKFTENGEVCVTIRSEPGRKNRFRFSVRDTGVGMDEAACRGLFTPFSQADGSTTRKFGGTGLGLAISRKLVCLMGSDISVESSPGRGSCFSFVLELSPCNDQTASLVKAPKSLSGQKVLLAVPHPATRKILMAFLKEFGMDPLSLENPKNLDTPDGLPLAAPAEVALILVDGDLADGDQVDGAPGAADPGRLAETLRERYGAPVIAVGSARTMGCGTAPVWADRMQLKPVKQSLLYSQIRDLGRSQSPLAGPSLAPRSEECPKNKEIKDANLGEKISGMITELGRLLDQNSLKTKSFSRQVSQLLAGTPLQQQADLLVIQADRFDFSMARKTFNQLRENVRAEYPEQMSGAPGQSPGHITRIGSEYRNA